MRTTITTTALLLALLGPSALPVQAQTPATTQESTDARALKPMSMQPPAFPLDRPYHRFTPGEQALLRAQWVALGPDDEPPFPLEGMDALVMDIRDAARTLQTRGGLRLVAHVNGAGKVTKVDVHQSPDEQLTRFAAYRLVETRFKRGLCDRRPCAMQFPLILVVGEE